MYAWIVYFVFSVVLNMLYPIVIMPLFNKMTPMEPSPLRDRIYELAKSVGFRVGRIQVIDSSKRTGYSNAAAYGFFGINGILLYDNLFKHLTEDEIIAVLCHELGHWKYGHTYQGPLASSASCVDAGGVDGVLLPDVQVLLLLRFQRESVPLVVFRGDCDAQIWLLGDARDYRSAVVHLRWRLFFGVMSRRSGGRSARFSAF